MSGLSFVLLLCILCVFTRCNWSGYVLKEVNVAGNGKSIRIFNKQQMRSYDGSDEASPIYMGIKGVVFDVSTGKRFYGKDSPYNTLVGKDATRAVAKMSLEPEDLTHDITGLSENDLKMLDETFEQTYMSKYPVVGYMDYLVDQYPDKFASINNEL